MLSEHNFNIAYGSLKSLDTPVYRYSLKTKTSRNTIVSGSELLLHAWEWDVSSERWFIVVLWFIRSIAERSNSPGLFMFQKGTNPQENKLPRP